MAWFSYLILSLNKILEIHCLVLAYQAWGAKTTCREWKGSDGIKKFEKHCFRLKLKASCTALEVLWTLTQEKLERQIMHVWNFRRQYICYARGWVWGVKRQKFATGIFKTEYVIFG